MDSTCIDSTCTDFYCNDSAGLVDGKFCPKSVFGFQFGVPGSTGESRPKNYDNFFSSHHFGNPSSPLNTQPETSLKFYPRSNDKDLLSGFAMELIDSRDPNLTKETLVLRALKRISEHTFNLSWSRVLEILQQRGYHLDRESHELLNRALELGAQQHDESIYRIASRDYLKKSDVDRLATVLGATSFEKNVPVCTLFAVDGFYEFHDLKLYANHFKCCEEFKRGHVSAVRVLYKLHELDALRVLRVVEFALGENGITPTDPAEVAAVDAYKNIVVEENLPAIRDWKTKERRQLRENLEKAKKAAEKKSLAEALKKKTDFAFNSAAFDGTSDSDDRVSEGDEVAEKKRKPEEKKSQRPAQPAKKRKVEQKKTNRPDSAKKPKSREEKKTKLSECRSKDENASSNSEVIKVYDSENEASDNDD